MNPNIADCVIPLFKCYLLITNHVDHCGLDPHHLPSLLTACFNSLMQLIDHQCLLIKMQTFRVSVVAIFLAVCYSVFIISNKIDDLICTVWKKQQL